MRIHLLFTLALLLLPVLCTCICAQEATQPSVMIMPADGLIKRLGHLKRVEIDGRTRTVQNYEQLFIDEPELRFAISQIQEKFAVRGFPLKDLEFSLKRINTEEAFDAAENIDIDLKAILLKSAQPDMYLDLDYFEAGSGLDRSLTFNIRAVDAYTNQAVSTASNSGIPTTSTNGAAMLEEQVERNIQNLQSQMAEHFADLKANGRAIALRVGLEEGAPIQDFRKERCGTLPYNHLVRDYLKRNTVNGAHHLQGVSAKEISYDVIRIPMYDDEGYPMGAADWTFQFSEYLNAQCGVFSIDNSSKLGEAYILFIAE
jgi:hypothetical protein